RAVGARKAITRGRAGAARGAARARTAEHVLRASAARFRGLTQLSSDWYWEQDAEFRLTFTSSYVGDRAGLAAPACLGRKRGEQLLRLEHSVTRSLAEAISPPHALRQALRWICETESWDCAEFWKVDEAAGILRRMVHWTAPGVPEAERFVERSRDLVFGP